MEAHVEKLSPVLVELRVQVPAQVVAAELNKAYQELGRKARVKGYRRGKAPRQVLAHLYGQAIERDVAQRLVDRFLKHAFTQKDIQPLSRPDVEPGEFASGQDFGFKARCEVRPEIAEVKWEGLQAKRPKVEVDNEELQAEIDKLRKEHATLQPVDEARGARAGELVSATLSFELNGEPQREDVEVEVGAGNLLPEIDEALVDMKVGDDKTVELTLPEQHPNAALRGRKTSFGIQVQELKERVLPEVDDELAKDCGDYDDWASLEKALRDKLRAERERQAEEDVARQLVAELCKENPVPLPPSLVEQQIRSSEQELQALARAHGQPLEPNAQLRERLREDAEMKVRAGLLMAEIARTKQVQVTEEDLEKGYATLAERSGKNAAKIRAEYRDPSKREQMVGMILEDKILTILEEAANVSEP